MLPLSQFGGQPIHVQPDQCLNGRHKDAGCHRCVEACPTQAIALYPQNDRSPHGPLLPQLTSEQCVRCGLCLHACPTDVFSQADLPEVKLAQTISNLSDAPLALVCPQHPDPAMATAPVAAVVRHQRCLASLSLSDLIDLSHNGQRELWLDDTPCAECPIGHVRPFIVQTAAAANRLLQAFDRPPAIHTPLNQPDLSAVETSPKPLLEGNQPKLSRRGLFSALSKVTVEKPNSESSAPPPTSGPIPVSQRLPHHLPSSRRRIVRQLEQLGTPLEQNLDFTDLPFAGVMVDTNTCSACGLCARFCPSEALHFVAGNEQFGLAFKPLLCLNCNVCVVACPEKAVSLSKQMNLAELVAPKPRWLVVGQLAACAGCGQATAWSGKTANNRPWCYSCRHSGGPMMPLKDQAGLMSDLLKRIPGQE